jgi:hypothetical protein
VLRSITGPPQLSLQCSSHQTCESLEANRAASPGARYGECAILVDLHELGRDPMILGKLLKG